ncbi:MAG: MFS transporter [Saccharolobus sp.]|uniref:MFS-type transporter n=1 Tax=Saccharolobus shibatae (strain ATCC 51178 / DSM 5389 / JCM 8931 / NBRC 15437 / B12) TaxID=523848 RepID=A0A8F5BP83_SACSH|nr:MFS transporter [Saccharolobus shibatae]QXJ28912.1 putative MFS-type transporter [Saccharolobus shibatae B12]
MPSDDYLKEIRRVSLAATWGTMFEYYDFLASSTAAGLVWSTIFYGPITKVPSIALALSLVTVALAYLVRPIGGLIFGHLGDRYGRKSNLIVTLVLMFIGSFGIAILPTYASIGLISVILLNVLRTIQGLGFGGEWGGASTWLMEFGMKSGKPYGIWSGLLQSGVSYGIGLSALAFSIATSVLNHSAFLSWGWRVIFIVGAIIVVIGIIIRYLTLESPIFNELKERRDIARLPSIEILKLQWKKIIMLAFSWWFVTVYDPLLVLPYSIELAIALKVSPLFGLTTPSYMLLVVGISAILGGISTFLGGIASDKLGRKKVMIIASGITALIIYPYLLLFFTRNPLLLILAGLLIYLPRFFGQGPLPAFFTEIFPAKYRYSGSGLAYQFGGLLTGIATGVIFPSILAFTHATVLSAWIYAGALGTIIAAVSFVTLLFIREEKTVY